jgi:hypothetical protein
LTIASVSSWAAAEMNMTQDSKASDMKARPSIVEWAKREPTE